MYQQSEKMGICQVVSGLDYKPNLEASWYEILYL